MKQRLVWFETPDPAAFPEGDALTTRDIERNQGVVDTLRGDELSRLQRAVILDPTVRVTTSVPHRRAKTKRPAK